MGMEIQINNLEEMCNLMCDNMLPRREIKRCLRCGKPLKTEDSIARGYGKTCEKKMQSEKFLQLF